jgi:peptidoglycan L-alanyl-D-glutamate endopeptidase CwlK
MNIRSLQRLDRAHPQLRKLFIEAAKKCPVDIEIGEVDRTKARQEQLVKAGASWTMNSRHIPKVPHHEWYGTKPVSHAVDFLCYVDGKLRWDFPLYVKAGEHIEEVAKRLKIDIVWGWRWKQKDGPHVELARKTYP